MCTKACPLLPGEVCTSRHAVNGSDHGCYDSQHAVNILLWSDSRPDDVVVWEEKGKPGSGVYRNLSNGTWVTYSKKPSGDWYDPDGHRYPVPAQAHAKGTARSPVVGHAKKAANEPMHDDEIGEWDMLPDATHEDMDAMRDGKILSWEQLNKIEMDRLRNA